MKLWRLNVPTSKHLSCSGCLLVLADPRGSGSCEIEHVTRQPMVGNFRQPGPSRTAIECQGNLKYPAPPHGCRREHKRDEKGGREGGIH